MQKRKPMTKAEWIRKYPYLFPTALESLKPKKCISPR